MTSIEELEFSITQYLDGTLSPEQAAALEARLGSDAEAASLLGQHRQLDALLHGVVPMPELNWDGFADRVTMAIDRQASAHKARWSIGWARTAGTVAAAACLAIAVYAFGPFHHSASSTVAKQPVATEPTGTVMVQGPSVEQAPGNSVIKIGLGSDHSTAAGSSNLAHMAMVDTTRPSDAR